MHQMITQILRTSTEVILSRFERIRKNYPFIDTKFHVVTGRDYDESDEPFRRKNCIYSWIQGRGLESLAKHILFFQASGEIKTADRLKDMLSVVTETMERLRAVNNGRLPFAMHPDGSPFFEKESDHANFSDLFYSKGLFAASRILGRSDWEMEAEKLFLFVLDEIEQGLFHTDQQCFDPKNKVSYIPGKFPQGPRMIALGGIADWIALIHYLLVAYVKFICRIGISLTEITVRIRDGIMMNYDLMEILLWDRKTFSKPPDWNQPQQPDLFGDFI